MAAIGVVGAGGTVGGLLAARLRDRGCTVVAVDPASDAPGLDPLAVLAAATPLLATHAPRLAGLAARLGAHYVDCSLEQASVAWAAGEGAEQARSAGTTVLPGAGLVFGLGDVLTAVAAAGRPPPREVHVSYAFPDRGGLLRLATPGLARSLRGVVGRSGRVRVDGGLVEERAGEARWLAWFPRPVGPRHAIGVPGGEAYTVPLHLPTARTVRTYLALPTWAAELVQLAWGVAAAWEPARRAVRAGLEAMSSAPAPATRASRRWACVVEVRGPDGVGRAWANGRDPHAVSAALMEDAIVDLAGTDPDPGLTALATLSAPDGRLDRLAAATGLRWSVLRPAGPEPDGPGGGVR